MIDNKIVRYGMVIGTKPEKLSLYKSMHADDYPGVRDILKKYNYNNFSIFIQQMPDGKEYLFAYFEYTGDNFEMDNKNMEGEPRYRAWLSQARECQVPIGNSTSWTVMERVFFLE